MRNTHAIDAIIARNIKCARLDGALSQMTVANYLNITYQQVQKYENGKDRISAARLWQLSLFYNIPIEDFFEG